MTVSKSASTWTLIRIRVTHRISEFLTPHGVVSVTVHFSRSICPSRSPPWALFRRRPHRSGFFILPRCARFVNHLFFKLCAAFLSFRVTLNQELILPWEGCHLASSTEECHRTSLLSRRFRSPRDSFYTIAPYSPFINLAKPSLNPLYMNYFNISFIFSLFSSYIRAFLTMLHNFCKFDSC